MNNVYNLLAQRGNMGAGNNFIQRLNEFKKTINGNPQEIVQSMLKNGRISQAQYDQAYQMASQIMQSLK